MVMSSSPSARSLRQRATGFCCTLYRQRLKFWQLVNPALTCAFSWHVSQDDADLWHLDGPRCRRATRLRRGRGIASSERMNWRELETFSFGDNPSLAD